ncbi:MAG: glycosyl hydrolase family 30, partial [Bacteroidota bacterium]
MISACDSNEKQLEMEVFETSANGNKLEKVTEFVQEAEAVSIKLLPEKEYQTITGFGGSFTEASAYLLNQLSAENRDKILEAYFGESGAKYSLTRTHMNSS